MTRPCSTHHYACDCREDRTVELLRLIKEVISWDENDLLGSVDHVDARCLAHDIANLRKHAAPIVKEYHLE